MITDNQHNHLVRTFAKRMETQGVKPGSKKFATLQVEEVYFQN